MLGAANLHLGLASTLSLLQPLKHPSPQYMEASGLGIVVFSPCTTFASAGGMLPFDTDPIAIPHPFLSTLLKGGLLRQIDAHTVDNSW